MAILVVWYIHVFWVSVRSEGLIDKQMFHPPRLWFKESRLSGESISPGIQPHQETMIFLKGGTFTMGSPIHESESQSDERPQHRVRVSDFYIDKTEVTQHQFQQVMGTNPSHFTDCSQCPVEQVSWYDAALYCNALSKQDGFDTVYTYAGIIEYSDTKLTLRDVSIHYAKNGYRLPTEAEWEFACRAATNSPFVFGKNLTTDQANYNGAFPYEGFPKGEYREKTVPVLSLPSNAWGLYGMHGNVWEWCNDWFRDYTKSQTIDPKGPVSGQDRVIRGGSWRDDAAGIRSAYRSRRNSGDRSSGGGFRCVRRAE